MSIQGARILATRVLERFRIVNPPVNVERIANKLGLHLLEDDLGPNVSGMLIRTGSQTFIFVAATEGFERRRFTIAHELGHHFMHHQLVDAVHVDRPRGVAFRSAQASSVLDPVEVEANQFAAALLMPARMVREHAEECGEDLLKEEAVARLAGEFQVSEQAMAIRLTTLGLL